MAANYTVVSQQRTVQVLSATQVADVQEVGFVTHPSGVYCQRYIPWAEWEKQQGFGVLDAMASAIEGLLSGGLATAATFAQDVDSSGLIADYLDFTVTYTPTTGAGLPMTTVVRVPVNALSLDVGIGTFLHTSPADLLNTAYQSLAATAGL